MDPVPACRAPSLLSDAGLGPNAVSASVARSALIRRPGSGTVSSLALSLSLSHPPHLLPPDTLLGQLGGSLLAHRLAAPPPDQLHVALQQPIHQLIIALLRELSARLHLSEHALRSARLEAAALRALLATSCAASQAEVEQCLVRARSAAKHPPPPSPWHLLLRPLGPALLSAPSAPRPSPWLDLDNLREAMSDNPSYDSAARSGLAPPSLRPMPSRPRALRPDTSSSSASSAGSRSLSTSSHHLALSRPPLPGSSQVSSSPQSPTHHPPTPILGRNRSFASHPSSASSHLTGHAPRNPIWAFYGWKWRRRVKPAPGSAQGDHPHPLSSGDPHPVPHPGTASHDAHRPLDPISPHSSPSSHCPHSPQIELPLQALDPSPHSAPFAASPVQPHHLPQGSSASSSLLNGFLDCLALRQRAGSVLHRPIHITPPETCPLMGSSTDLTLASSLPPAGSATDRSSSLLMDSSCSATTHTPSTNSPSSLGPSCSPCLHSSSAAPPAPHSQLSNPGSAPSHSSSESCFSHPHHSSLFTTGLHPPLPDLLPPGSSEALETLLAQVPESVSQVSCGHNTDPHHSSASMNLLSPVGSTSATPLHPPTSHGPLVGGICQKSSCPTPRSTHSSLPPSRRPSSTNAKSPAHSILSASKCLPAVAAVSAESLAYTTRSKTSLPPPATCDVAPSDSSCCPGLNGPGVQLFRLGYPPNDDIFSNHGHNPRHPSKAHQITLPSWLSSARIPSPRQNAHVAPDLAPQTLSRKPSDLGLAELMDKMETRMMPPSRATTTDSGGSYPDNVSGADLQHPLPESVSCSVSESCPHTGSKLMPLPAPSSVRNPPPPLPNPNQQPPPKGYSFSSAKSTLGRAIGLYTLSPKTSTSTHVLEPNVTTVPNAAFGRLSSASPAAPIPSTPLILQSKTGFTNPTAFPPLVVSPSIQASHSSSSASVASGSEASGSIFHRPPAHYHPHHLKDSNQALLPSMSYSTMELCTLTGSQSDLPPLFSNVNNMADNLSRAASPSDLGSESCDREPLTDRFGFIVDGKLGLKLLRQSRSRKNKLPSKVVHSPSLGPLDMDHSDVQEPTATWNHLALNSSRSSLSPPRSHQQQQSSDVIRPADGLGPNPASEGLEVDHVPMMTTALPIKSKVDVEAELAFLRDALGLTSAPPENPLEDKEPEGDHSKLNQPSRPSIKANSTECGLVDCSTQSVKRLLNQLNEMHCALEKTQIRAWGDFIAKRKAKLIKSSNGLAHHPLSRQLHPAVPSLAAHDPTKTNKLKVKGTGNLTPESVGAFLGLARSDGPRRDPGERVSASTHPSTRSSTCQIMLSAPRRIPKSQLEFLNPLLPPSLDLITCHDNNLIGIASMGVSSDSSKIALRDDWSEFKALVKKGVPISLRPKIWLECSGASEIKEPGYYDELLNLHKGEGSMCLGQIECDVTRTLPTNVYFGGDGPGVEKLRRVLAAMSWHNPVVGYCQGMNMVAATILLTIPSEEDAFWILVCIVDKILPTDYYTSHLLTSQADQRVLRDLVSKHLPVLWTHLDSLDVELPAITFGWFLSLFADALPIQTLLRVFDLFLIDGSLLLFRIALALLRINQSAILSHDSPASLYAYMRGPMTLSSHHADKLIEVATEQFKELKNEHVVTLRTKHIQDLKEEMGIK